MTRTPHTEAERAEQALGVAQRKVDRTEAKLADARKLVKDLEAELGPLTRIRDHLATHPSLPQEDEDPDDELLAGDIDASDPIGDAVDETLAEFPGADLEGRS